MNMSSAQVLRALAGDQELLWNVARRAIEDALVEYRDMRLSLPTRGNGLVIREKGGKESPVIRMGPEDAVRIGLLALADHLEKP